VSPQFVVSRADAVFGLKGQLSSEQFYVARSGKYAKHHEDGLYRCVCCNTALFDSKTKFESGTGWPSYWEPIAKENVKEVTDNSLGMQRVEVECVRCGGHLGHVFPDGPKPTGLRYCMNGVALTFRAGS
jgi:peptide-methionine (R)-S-oxide reductase